MLKVNSKFLKILIILGITANLLDLFTTITAIELFGLTEGNYLMNALYQNPLGYLVKAMIGFWFFLPIKYISPYWFVMVKYPGKYKSALIFLLSTSWFVATVYSIILAVDNTIKMVPFFE